MELWVRSQDKNILQKTNALFISHTNENIYSICDNQNLTKYGEYKTKERALEILDEIQNIFSLNIKSKTYENADLFLKAKMLDTVYEMPEE